VQIDYFAADAVVAPLCPLVKGILMMILFPMVRVIVEDAEGAIELHYFNGQ